MTQEHLPAKSGNGHQPEQKTAISPAKRFREMVGNISRSLLVDWVGEERANEAIGRIAAAISASAASARNPQDFYSCTPQSVAQCVAVAALTGLMPSTGSSALAYVVPQRPRKDEDPQLQYMISHRGLNALARRCGQTMIAIPVSYTDEIESTEDGGVRLISRDIDNPPTTEKELRGVIVQVRQNDNGIVTCCGWVPAKLIQQRKKISRSANSNYSPWSTWPVEMAMKTAMHYTISRGWCVIDDTSSVRALSVDVDADTIPQRRIEQDADLSGLSVEHPEGRDDDPIDVEVDEPVDELNETPAEFELKG